MMNGLVIRRGEYYLARKGTEERTGGGIYKMKEKAKVNKAALAIVIGIIIAAAVALELLSGYLFGKGIKQAWDVCYPMANANISWEQTHYNGPWNGE